jgi:hypothetical protein
MNPFIRGPQLAELLGRCTQAALEELGSLDADYVLTENLEVLVESLVVRHLPEPVSVDWTAASATPIEETTIERAVDDFGHFRRFEVAGSRITICYPLTGSAEILRRQASTLMLVPNVGTIRDNQIQLEIKAPQLSTERIQQEIAKLREDVGKRIKWANHDVNTCRASSRDQLKAAAIGRRDRIIEHRKISAALQIPITPNKAPRPPVPARRRQVSLDQRRATARYAPEPVLEKAIYKEILDVVENWALSLERTCTPPIRALEEEALRDLLLGTLNGYWKGGALGELFNGAGKTDILIRENGRNVFIAECKIWDGASKATVALDQLLSYLVWRDTKAALIVFFRRGKPAEVIGRLHQAVREHPRHMLTVAGSATEQRVDYIFSAADDERRIELAVIPVVLRADPAVRTG